MRIVRKASAGTMQSSDLMVMVEPDDGLRVEIESTVEKQFGHLIRERVMATLGQLGIDQGHFRISDRGALDYAITARIETAVRRAAAN